MQTESNTNKRLKRTFCEISDEALNNIEQENIFYYLGLSIALDWEQLLKSSRVLIISEAGSGKTYECQEEQKSLWDKGEAAFFLELAQLGLSNVRDLLSPAEEERFDAWHASQSGTATFFLDSFDELKLTQGSFRTALTRLERALAGRLDRVRIVITTRPIPFDEQEFKKRLPVPMPIHDTQLSPEQTFAEIAIRRTRSKKVTTQEYEAPIWRRVYLMPLSNEQISEMATIQDISDPHELLAAIRQRNAEDFTRRPLDLIELCADWREYRRIRTHQEQLEHNINIKLKPRSDREELTVLSPERALDGASRLTLACLLSRKLTLRHSVESDKVPVTESALDPTNILRDWNEEERKTLLERALFGIANYGRVRFHHRSVMEYLAAQQIKKLLKSGMSTKTLKRMLFAETPQGIKVIKPSLRPVAAWLAESDQIIFNEILEREPEVLLNFGDPESLGPDQRNLALRAYVERYKLGSWRGINIPIIQIHRFANSELAPVINELWKSGIENSEVRQLLIELIGAGNISECADIALDIAMDETAELRERCTALESLQKLADSHIPDVVESMLDQPKNWPEQLLKAGILSFFPTNLSIEQLASLLARTSESPLKASELTWHWPRVIAECTIPPEYLDALREKLTDLVIEQAESVHSGWGFTTPRYYLVNALVAVCLRQLSEGCRSEALFKSSTAVFRFSREGYASRQEPVSELQRKLNELPDQYRESLFWADIEFTQQFHPERTPDSRFFRTWQHGLLQLDRRRDNSWGLKNLADQSLPLPERMLALKLALSVLWDNQTDIKQYVHSLIPLVEDCQELSDRLLSYLQPVPKNPEHEQLEKRAKRMEKKRKRREARDIGSWIIFWREVSHNPDKVFCADRRENTAWNLWNAAKREGDTEVAGWNRSFIEKHFNKEIADRLRLTLMDFWRKDNPTLRCERPKEEKETYLTRWQMGLSGIYAESEDPDWARKLSHEEALLAARYVLLELNRLPNWLLSLAVAHPRATEMIIGMELASELAETAKPNSYYKILQHLRHESQPVVELFIAQLVQWLDNLSPLQQDEDKNVAGDRLRQVVNLLLSYGDEEIRARIENKAKEQLATGLDTAFASVWLYALLRLSPNEGTQMLMKVLEGRENDKNSPGELWIGQLFGDFYQERIFDISSQGFTPDLLLELLRLAYKHVRPKDDITHEGTYSPGDRDHAQRGRDMILSAVLNLSGPEGWAIKQQIADDPLFYDFRDRALWLARETVAQEIGSRIYDIADILDLYQAYESPPASRDELFELMLDRLDDLEDFLLRDDSPRELWASISNERIMRREIARVLADKANGTYTVDQESVTADEKETDIRLRIAKYDLQGVIELKLGDGRSGRDLRDTLKDQIVMKYMAPENRRAGCLLVTVARERTWEHPETGAVLDIDGLRNMLKDEANKIVDETGFGIKLTTKVLDLRTRLPKENWSSKGK